jgi:hypothetical protein
MRGSISLGLKTSYHGSQQNVHYKAYYNILIACVNYRLNGLTSLLHETEQVVQEFLPLGIVIYLVQLKEAKEHCCLNYHYKHFQRYIQ